MPGAQARLSLKQAVSPELGPDVEHLTLTVDASLPDVLHVKLTDADGKRWQVPPSLLATSAGSAPGEPAVLPSTLVMSC